MNDQCNKEREVVNVDDRGVAQHRRPNWGLRLGIGCLVSFGVVVLIFGGLLLFVNLVVALAANRVGKHFMIPESQFADHGGVRCAAWSPDGSMIASGSNNHTVHLWDVKTKKQLRSLEHKGKVASVAFNHDGSQLATASHRWDSDRNRAVSELRVWNPATGDQVYVMEHSGEARNLAFRKDGKQIAIASSDLVRVCDAKTGQELQALAGDAKGDSCVAWSPEGTHLASGSSDGKVRFWDATSGDYLFSLEAANVHSIAFSPDGNKLAASHENSVQVWDVATQKPLLSLKVSGSGNKGHRVAYSPDGSRIAWGVSHFALFDATSGEKIYTGDISRSINAHYHVTDLAFSPDGTRVVGACTTNEVRVWELPMDGP